ncbi:hypothetical protein [Burkholderia ambifaria]|uniref:hypothetical protein n=1 Tax=Burkholderia ambifaria TaxID=152480 RepID=UPI00158E082C|nr:hypothetical protein [Burkholderia ambifaria]
MSNSPSEAACDAACCIRIRFARLALICRMNGEQGQYRAIQRYAAPMQMLNLSSKWLGLKLETCQSNGKQALIWCNELAVRALAEIRTPTIALCFNFERRFPASGAAIFPMIQRRWLIRLGFHGEHPRTSASRRTSGGCVCSKSASGRDRIVSEVFTVVSLWRTAGFDVR